MSEREREWRSCTHFFVNAPLPGVLLCIIIIIFLLRETGRPSVFFALHLFPAILIYSSAPSQSRGAWIIVAVRESIRMLNFTWFTPCKPGNDLLLVSYPCPRQQPKSLLFHRKYQITCWDRSRLWLPFHTRSPAAWVASFPIALPRRRAQKNTRHVRLPKTAKREIFVMPAASAQNSHNYGGNNKNEITLAARRARRPSALLSFDTQCFWPAAVKQKIDIFTNCAPLARLNFFSPRSTVRRRRH